MAEETSPHTAEPEPRADPKWDLTELPTSMLLDMLVEYQHAYEYASGKEFDHPIKHHHATHFYNMRWSVARELERRGVHNIEGLPQTQKAIGRIVARGRIVYPVSMLLKAVGLQTGERWITVHPHGDNEAGVPVLIREHEDGTSSVIGGAGGSLNYLKLTNIKSPKEYQEAAKQRSAEKRAAEKERQEGMTPEQKELERAAKGGLEDRQRETEIKTIQRVYQAMGVEAPKFRDVQQIAEEEGVDVPGAKIARAREIKAHLAAVNMVASIAKEQVLNDHEYAAKAGLGEVSLRDTSDKNLYGVENVGIDLLTGKKPTETPGVSQQFGKRAKEQAGEGALAEETKLVRERRHEEIGGEMEERAHVMADKMRAWNEQAKQLVETGAVRQGLMTEMKVPEPEQVMEILRAQRELQKFRQHVAKEKGKAEKGLQISPVIADYSNDVDAEIVSGFNDEIGVRTARAMLARVASEQGLTKHVRAGAFAALNDAALTVAAQEVVSRDLVDAFGAAGAAKIMAARLKATMDPSEFRTVQEALSAHHGKTGQEVAQQALDESAKLLDQAKQIEITAEEAIDLPTARTLNERRQELVEQARESLGLAYGRLTALAQLNDAMQNARPEDEIKLDLGDMERETAVSTARAFGLIPDVSDVPASGEEDRPENKIDVAKIGGSETAGDYRIEHGAGHTYITLQPSAVDKLAEQIDPHERNAYDRAQAIKKGTDDEPDWLPAGIERRPATTFDDPTYEAGRFDNTIRLHEGSSPEEMHTGLNDFVGAQVAEGQDIGDLRTSLYSPEFLASHIPPHLNGEFRAWRSEFMPLATLTDEEKKLPSKERNQRLMEKNDKIRQTAEKVAQDYSAEYKRRNGLTDEDLVALHTQRIPITPEQTGEAIHRTLASVPAASVAFTPLGNLDHEGRAALREHFLRNIAKIPEKQAVAEPEGQGKAPKDVTPAKQMNIFGELEDVLPEQPQEGASAAEQASPEAKAWKNYVTAMGGQQKAYQTLQGIIRGDAMTAYAKNHGQVFGKPIKTGRERLPNWEQHLIGRLPEEKLKEALGSKYAEAQRLMARIATRVGGKFAKEEEGNRAEAAQQLQSLIKESQLGLFETGQFPSLDRATIGHDAEKQLASVWGNAAGQFKAKGKGVKLIKDLSMSGEKVKQQRAIKFTDQFRRVGLHLGAGSGKSLTSIGAFTHLHSKGEATKAVFVVPSAVLGQFGSEMLRYTTPGKYKWLADPSASHEDRMAAYGDDSTHMVVTTHDSFRDDLAKMIGKSRAMSEGGKAPSRGDVLAWFNAHDEPARHKIMEQALKDNGVKLDVGVVDEAQDILNRAGKEDSGKARLIDAFSAHMPTYMSLTGTPVKNDETEGFDVLHKLDPKRFPTEKRDEFRRKYGANTPASKASLQRLMARYVYTDRIPSGVNRTTDEKNLPLTERQQAEYSKVTAAFNKARMSRKRGSVDVEAVRALAPDAFEGVPGGQHQQIADEIALGGLGTRKENALNRVVNSFDFDHNAKAKQLLDDLKTHKDEPHVIFAHHYDSIEKIKEACKRAGVSFVEVNGKKTSAEKQAARLAFQPEGDEKPKASVIICSDAGATGQNLQRGKILINYDTPDTAKTHEQRIARIDRLGQTQDVTVRDYVTDTPHERKMRKRLGRKYALSDVFQSPSELIDDSGLAAEIQAQRAARRNAGGEG